VVFAGAILGQYTGCALFTPIMDVGGNAGPEEALAKAMEGLVRTEMTSGGSAVKSREDEMAKVRRDDDEQQAVVLGREVLEEDEMAAEDLNRVLL